MSTINHTTAAMGRRSFMKACSAGFAAGTLSISASAVATSRDGLDTGLVMLSGDPQPVPTYYAVKESGTFTSSEMTQTEIRYTFDQFLAALKRGDIAALSKIYSDDYLLVRPDGSILTKKQILDDLKVHSMVFTSFEITEVLIKTTGTVGILSADVRNVFVRDGRQGRTHARQVIVFLKAGNQVQITYFQSTNILGDDHS